MGKRSILAAIIATLVATEAVAAQTFPTADPVIRRLWQLGMDESQAPQLAQVLMDSIGPRLTGTPGQKAAHDWAVKMYESWGIPGRNEQYGTWTGWRRGITHVDLIAPRVRSLEGMMMAWSGGTGGRPVEGDVIVLPEFTSAQDFQAWLGSVRGKYVALDFAEPTCRPNSQWQEFGAPAPQGGTSSFERMSTERDAARSAWQQRLRATGLNIGDLRLRLEEAGAAGILHSRWSNDYGVNKVFSTNTRRIPSVDLSCEDYGLIVRLAENNQGPRLRVTAESEFTAEAPTFNTIAEIKGTQLPNEYVLLSAHFDSWDGSSGATDNGTGTITMMEAMRILKLAYPNPRRTILVGHWSGEEQGLNGSRAFAEDHPEIVNGLQAVWNQDNGTGRIERISLQGLVDAGGLVARWMARLPTEITGHVSLIVPGQPGRGGSDYASFLCHGAPAFSLSSLSWDYGTYTWHTNRDTYDKVVFEEVRENAVLMAMLAYLAAEDPERVPRAQLTVFPVNPETGEMGQWPACTAPERSSAEER